MAGKAKRPTGKNSKTINAIICDVEKGKVLTELLERVFSHNEELTRMDVCHVVRVGEEQIRKYERGKDTISPEKAMLFRVFFSRHDHAPLADEFIRRMREIEDDLMAIYTNDSSILVFKDSEGGGSHMGYFVHNLQMHLGRDKPLSYEEFSEHIDKNRAQKEQKNRKSSQQVTPEQLRGLAEFKSDDSPTKDERDTLIKIIRFSGVPLKEWRYVFAGDVLSV